MTLLGDTSPGGVYYDNTTRRRQRARVRHSDHLTTNWNYIYNQLTCHTEPNLPVLGEDNYFIQSREFNARNTDGFEKVIAPFYKP